MQGGLQAGQAITHGGVLFTERLDLGLLLVERLHQHRREVRVRDRQIAIGTLADQLRKDRLDLLRDQPDVRALGTVGARPEPKAHRLQACEAVVKMPIATE